MLRHEYKCLFAYFRNLFIEIFRIVMFILIFYPLELHKVQHDCHTKNQSRTNGPINAHLTIDQVMTRYKYNNEKQEALL